MSGIHTRALCDCCHRPVGDAALVTRDTLAGPLRLCPSCEKARVIADLIEQAIPEPPRLHADPHGAVCVHEDGREHPLTPDEHGELTFDTACTWGDIDTEPPGDDEWRDDGQRARDALGLALTFGFWACVVGAGAVLGAWLAGVL